MVIGLKEQNKFPMLCNYEYNWLPFLLFINSYNYYRTNDADRFYNVLMQDRGRVQSTKWTKDNKLSNSYKDWLQKNVIL